MKRAWILMVLMLGLCAATTATDCEVDDNSDCEVFCF